jgi:aminotransferase
MNKRLANLMQSEIRNMSIECDRVGGINLSQGICDLPLPKELMDGADRAIRAGVNQYTRYDGLAEARAAIAGKAKTFNHIDADPEVNITVTAGATGALYCACFSLLSPGDEVLLFMPFYGYHEYTILANDLVPVYATLSPPAWSFDIDELERKVTSKTKAIMINTPANPCGKVFTREEIEQLGDFCIRHDLLIFTDEIYEYITYDNRVHVSPGSIDKIKDRVITISGYSKTFSITGWRIGYSIASPAHARMIGMANDLIYVCAPAPLQLAVARTIDSLDHSFYEGLRQEFDVKRDLICTALTECGFTPHVPQGAYYVLADISRAKGQTSKEKCMWILEKSGVASVPGESFYHGTGGETMARFCFAKDDDVLLEAGNRLRKLCKDL